MAAIRHYKPDTHKPKRKPTTDPARAAVIDSIHFTNGMLAECKEHTDTRQRSYFMMLRSVLAEQVDREQTKVNEYIKRCTK